MLQAHGVQRVLVCGVHLNFCVLGRGFGVRELVGSMGLTAVLLRDLTDSMYSRRSPPYADHFLGTALITRHVEAHVCATANSAQLLAGRTPLVRDGFRFAGDAARGRVAIGGFQHETNVFASTKATYADFVVGGTYPPLSRGLAMLEAVRHSSLPIAGFMDEATNAPFELVPLTCAWPGLPIDVA